MNGVVLSLTESHKKEVNYYFIDGEMYKKHFLSRGVDIFRGYEPNVYGEVKNLIKKLNLSAISFEEAWKIVRRDRLQMVSVTALR